jgi:hypothetical protein
MNIKYYSLCIILIVTISLLLRDILINVNYYGTYDLIIFRLSFIKINIIYSIDNSFIH